MAQRWAIYVEHENSNGEQELKAIKIFERESTAIKAYQAMQHVADNDTQFTYDRFGRSQKWRQNAIE